MDRQPNLTANDTPDLIDSAADLAGTKVGRTGTDPLCIIPYGRGIHGKSHWIRWSVDRALTHGRQVIVIDADRTNATLSGFFSDVLKPPSGDDADMRDFLVEFFERQISDRFNAAIDLGAGDMILKQLAREIGLAAFLERYGVRSVAVHLLGPNPDDLAYLNDLEQDQLFAPKDTILVLNEALVPQGRSAKAAFQASILDHTVFRRAIERGATPVWMPRLLPAAAHEVETRRLTFTGAAENQERSGQTRIGPWNAQLVHNWLRQMEESFAPVAHLLP